MLTTKDDLIHQLGEYILSHPPTDGAAWGSLALVVEFDDGARSIHGYYYDAAGESEPASVEDFEIVNLTEVLRTAMHEAGKAAWRCCLIQMIQSTRRIVVTFEYDDPHRWHITPKNLLTIPLAIRPPAAL